MVPEQTVRVCPVSTRRATLSAAVPSTEKWKTWRWRTGGSVTNSNLSSQSLEPLFEGKVLSCKDTSTSQICSIIYDSDQCLLNPTVIIFLQYLNTF